MNNTIYTGHVTRYDKEKQFGFIETADKQSYFFFRDKAEITRLKKAGSESWAHAYAIGDEVEFQVRPSGKENGRLEAFEINFIRNEQRNKLIEEAMQGEPLTGYLKSIKEKLFVKHISTYQLIPVDISAWETGIEAIYKNRLDSMVTFRLAEPNRIGKLTALIEGRQFSPVYEKLIALKDSGESIKGIITGKNEDGYFVTVFEAVEGFIVNPKNRSTEESALFFKYEKGDEVMVTIKAMNKNRKLSLEIGM
ncbi:hypothetical protein BH11BAC4_BH11BAC4_08850 [soil metagenome]